jgi:hypothetical protein
MSKQDPGIRALENIESTVEEGSWGTHQTGHVPSDLVRGVQNLPEDFDSVHVGLDLPVFLGGLGKYEWITKTLLDDELEDDLEELMGSDLAFHYSTDEEGSFYENKVGFRNTVDVIRQLYGHEDVQLYHTDQLNGALAGKTNAVKRDTAYSEVESFRSLRNELNNARTAIARGVEEFSQEVAVTEKITEGRYDKEHLDDEFTDLTEDEIWAKALEREARRNTGEYEEPLVVMGTYDRGFSQESSEVNLSGDHTVALPPELIPYVAAQK